MSKPRFIGILLIITGLLFIIIGAVITFLNRNPSSNSDLKNIESNKPESSQPSSFVVNLPAPGSIVASPLLIRGKVYGPQEKILVQLITSDGQVLVDTTTFASREQTDSSNVALFQTSLVFAKPQSSTGTLHLQLVTDDDKIIKEEKLPLTFRR